MATAARKLEAAPDGAPLIYSRMSAVMAEVGSVGKAQENKFDHYRFRGIDDVMNALQPAMVKHGVFCCPDSEWLESVAYQSQKGTPMQLVRLRVTHTFYAADGSSVEVTTIGEAADRGDKASNKAMAAAYKYAMLQAFCVPTEEKKDADHDSPEAPPAQQRQAARPTQSRGTARNTSAISDAQRKLLFAKSHERARELGIDADKTAGADILRSVIGDMGWESTTEIKRESMDGVLAGIAKWEVPREMTDAEKEAF